MLHTEHSVGYSDQGGESCGLNDRVHRILCQYWDKTDRKINYISTYTYSFFYE